MMGTLNATAAATKSSLIMLNGERGGAATTTDGDYMVVPQLLLTRDKYPVDHHHHQQQQLEDFLLETNFEGLTGTILSPPTIDYDNNAYCTIVNGDPHLSATPHSTFPQLFFTGESDNNSSYTPHPPVKFTPNDDDNGRPSFDDIGFDGDDQFDGDPPAELITLDPTDGAIGAHKQFRDFDGSSSSWLSEMADLAFMEKLAVENEQKCELLMSDLRLDNGGGDGDGDYDEESETGEGDPSAESMLEDIYRQAHEIDHNTSSYDDEYTSEAEEIDDDITVESAPPPPPVRVAPKIPHKLVTPAPQFHLADHDFGFKKMIRGPRQQQQHRSSGNRKRRQRTAAKPREAVLRSKKRLQNREAALRYRLKKRSERMEKEGELGQILARNQYLKSEKRSLAAEVAYMKELLLEIRKMKGIQLG